MVEIQFIQMSLPKIIVITLGNFLGCPLRFPVPAGTYVGAGMLRGGPDITGEDRLKLNVKMTKIQLRRNKGHARDAAIRAALAAKKSVQPGKAWVFPMSSRQRHGSIYISKRKYLTLFYTVFCLKYQIEYPGL